MSFELGNKVKIQVTGASHAPKITVKLSGISAGFAIDSFAVETMLDRRAGGGAVYTTARKEADRPNILAGIADGITTGEDIEAEFINSNVRRQDYENLKFVPRPSHADYAAFMKYKGNIDLSGGGFFSGRMTLPVVFAGAVCRQILEEKGILIGAHIASVGNINDDRYDPVEECLEINADGLPVLNPAAGEKMEELMTRMSGEGDSIGGVIECKITGLPVGLGEPIYDSVESQLSYAMFGIPAVKGIEFGSGFDITKMQGSEANDSFSVRDGEVRTVTNHSGGIQGGITNGMPVVFRVAIKPTPSIYKTQKSFEMDTKEETDLTIKGRHDACIVPRAVPCVEAMCAIVLLDLFSQSEDEV